MNYEEMLSWVLFYTRSSAPRSSPMVDVVDPGGLVRSQVIESDNGALRLTLNGAEKSQDAWRVISSPRASARRSSTWHSRTDDIFATAAAMAHLGFRALEISANYYDDLEARFGIDPILSEQLRAHNILYDHDEMGEYFQFYSTNYGEGFFFEIVERRGSYSGYGAANAPFRIAAQKRYIRPKGLPLT
jgi:4-hydroxyphenylpyruvate dioxygenase